MADEMVTLRIRVAGNPRDIRKFNKEINDLAVKSKLATTRGNALSTSVGGLNQKLKDFNKNNKMLSKMMLGIIGAFDKLGKMTVKLGTIGFGGILASLSLLSAAFKVGTFLVKAYQASMAGLAAIAASAVAAIAAFAAAQRELNAATNAYTNKSAPALGSSFNQSRAALRNLQHDTQLATAGMEALNATFAAVSKNASFDAKAQKALRALDDFASAGGDRGKNLAAAGEFYGLVQKGIASGKLGLTAEIEKAGAAISPAFEKGLKEFKKKGGKKNLQTLQQAILSGELAQMGGVTGQAQAVNDTLINILKGYFTRVQAMFADMGQPLLTPIKKAADGIFKIIRDTMARIAPDIEAFGSGTLLESLVSGFEKVNNFFIKLMREYLPKSEGMLKGFGKWWDRFLYGWNALVERLGGAAAAGKEINKIFGGAVLYVFERLGRMVQFTQDLIAKNPEKFQTLSDVIQKIAGGIADLYMFFARTFVDAAPAIERVVDLVIDLVDHLGNVLGLLRGFGNAFSIPGLGDLAVLVAMLAGGGLAKSFLGGKMGGIAKGAKAAKNMGSTVVYGAGGKGSGGGITGAAGRGAGRVKTFLTGGGATGAGAGAGAGGKGRGGGRIRTPMTSAYSTGYGRGRANGAGRLASANRGIRGAYMSRTGGGLGVKNKLGSTGGGIGLGLATAAIGGKFMDESAQSGVQLGSTMMMMGMPPMLAAGAGLGLAAMNARTGAGGALLGAGSGAAIGAMAGGPVGAVIGAAIGGVVGAIKGFANKAKAEKKAARASAAEVVNGYKNELLAGMIQGSGAGDEVLKTSSGKLGSQINFLRQYKGMSDTAKRMKATGQLQRGEITKEQFDQVTMKQLDTYTGELEKQKKTMEEAARGPLKTYNDRMKELKMMTGMTSEEIHKLAMENGVNLYDSTLTLSDAFNKLGKTVDITAAGIIGATRDIAVKTLGMFDEIVNRRDSELVYNEAAEKMRQLGSSATEADYAEFYRTAYEQLQVLNPNASQFELNDIFSKTFGSGGTAYSMEGSPLFGMTGGVSLANRFTTENLAAQKGALADQLVSAMAGSNLAVNRGTLLSGMANMTSEQLTKIQSQVASGDFSAFTDKTKNAANDQAERALTNAGFAGVEVVKMATSVPEQLSEAAVELRNELVNGVTMAFENAPSWLKEKPDWFTKESFEALIDDTHTPRGGRIGDTGVPKVLGRTMARHNYINSMVTGSRKITSSYRTYGLGSINSDHVTGRAYDLTGQNLGMYATAVKGMGGFAEFHGVGGDRHLHVVPGPSPIGDMSAPRMVGAAVAPNVASSDSITVNVYGAAGQDEAIIAQKVVSILDKRQRSTKERM